jgi:hypothetical protein
MLANQLPRATYEYMTIRVEKDLGFLEWTVRAGGCSVHGGADSFLVRDGTILVQTGHSWH